MQILEVNGAVDHNSGR